ncbi:unnamed protein product [Allacma fusca]|uniref:Calponin-homology (CH) domain-containing protein n=1 Tax=Allacma fusca TaxID=39272 RepID=A0A8J2JJS7_9HEXA|nr:unnamed protein product [Allacma fusca]
MSKIENRVSENKSLDNLYSWIDTIPLSRPKRSIARDFADGVLVAEVIAHFVPKIVEMHNYPAASSWTQKRVNWQTLNRRVFPKIGVRISEEIIEQLIDAKPGVIEQVLWDLRLKLDQICFASDGKINRWAKSVTQHPTSRKSSLTAQPTKSGTNDAQLTYRVSNTFLASQSKLGTKLPQSESSDCFIRENAPTTPSYIAPTMPSHLSGFDSKILDSMKKRMSPTSQFNSGFVVSPSTHQTQGYVAPPTIETSPSAHGCLNGPIVLSPIVDKNDNINAGGPPAQIIYRGHKMIPLQFLDDREKEIRSLESSNRSLTLKIHRLETLVNVKDQRIEDLTHQLQNLRSMYESVTDSTFTGST